MGDSAPTTDSPLSDLHRYVGGIDAADRDARVERLRFLITLNELVADSVVVRTGEEAVHAYKEAIQAYFYSCDMAAGWLLSSGIGSGPGRRKP